MKTKDLIRELQEADPSGEIECCVGNIDIYFVDVIPAYYDGTLEVLRRDPNNEFYNVIGADYVREGRKVNLVTLSIEDAIFNYKDMEVGFIGCSDSYKRDTQKSIDEWRAEYRDIEKSVAVDNFIKYVEKHTDCEDKEEIKRTAIDFFERNLSVNDLLPQDLKDKLGLSWNDKRELQWNRELEIGINEKLFIKRKEERAMVKVHWQFGKEFTKLEDVCQAMAHNAWEEAGKPEGKSDHFWFEAEKLLDMMGYDIKVRDSLSIKHDCCPYNACSETCTKSS